MYTVCIGTSSKSILLFLSSKSIFVSYSKRSPFISQNKGRYFNGTARSPVCVSDILSPQANLNTKLVILFPNLLLKGTSFPEKSLTPNITLSTDFIICSQQALISSALCWLSPSTVTTPSMSGLLLIQYSKAVLSPLPFPLLTEWVRIVHCGYLDSILNG